MLVFLNTDALVEPGWYAPLERALAMPGVAAAVPLVLELDGRIQCAGALLGRDGTVIEHGNGEDAGDRAYRFPRAVDFGPGACLAVRADAFTGFDDAYAPAYYEDADLCLALDGRTLYVPEATVRHAKKASGGTELAHRAVRAPPDVLRRSAGTTVSPAGRARSRVRRRRSCSRPATRPPTGASSCVTPRHSTTCSRCVPSLASALSATTSSGCRAASS